MSVKKKDFLIITILTLGSLQLLCQYFPAFWLAYHHRNPEHFWREKFAANYKAGSDSMAFLDPYDYHPTRGWTLKPNVDYRKNGNHVSSNALGFRSVGPYVRDEKKAQVLVVGDSFTFGSGLSNDETWPHRLESKLPNSQVINLGVDGYGMDQMLVTLQESVGKFRPKIVVCAFIDDDLERNLLYFRDYKKPRFEITNRTLTLTNVPIASPETTYREMSGQRLLDGIAVLHLPRLVWQVFDSGRMDRVNEEIFTLGRAIVESMEAVARGAGADFTLVHLSHRNKDEDGGKVFLDFYKQRHPQTRTVSTLPAFQKRPQPMGQGHYNAEEADVAAGAIASSFAITSTSKPL